MKITYESELYHHGVKGMRWGVRKKSTKSSQARKKMSFKAHEDYRKAHKKKSIRRMSDKELADRNKRLSAEQQYKKLTKKSSKGRLAVKVILSSAGAATVTAGAVYLGAKYSPQLISRGAEIAGRLAAGSIG